MKPSSVEPTVLPSEVAEIQGLYGPFSFPEKLLQKLWLQREFDTTALRTADGRRVEIVHPGRWNRLGGPDFHEARLRIGGVETIGDIEVHLRATDWQAHGHARDEAYASVVLHVVLFPPGELTTPGWGGRPLPIAALLPLLHHDLEEYAAVEAVETLANRPSQRILERLGGLAPDAADSVLRGQARQRWEQKVHFAGLRRERLGWEEACHHAALEILGYRFNRAPMLQLATTHPLPVWRSGPASVERLLAEQSDRWSLQGVRPANHPRVRLAQYAQWTQARPAWPSALQALETPAVGAEATTAAVRRLHRLVHWREAARERVCGDAVGGTRFDTLMCDGLLPLLAAAGKGGEAGGDLFGLWYHWFPGDLPTYILQGLRDLGLAGSRERPSCHGLAQGLLGWLLAQEKAGADASCATPVSPGRGA
ncbi:MAG TPA: DUF2851 family protein [Opitutaceae bacterium]